MASGFLRIATLGKVDFRVHWIAPVVWLIAGLAMSTGALGFGGVLVAMVVYLVHVAGHYLVARAYQLKVLRVDIDGTGGSVQYSGRAPRMVHARVAFGGLIAQVGLGFVLMAVARGGSPVVSQMLWVNFVLGAINLLPFGRLDGAAGWRHWTAAMKQPMPVPDEDDDHPVMRAQRLVAEADRDIGHSRVDRPDAIPLEDALSETVLDAADPTVREIAREFETLMAEVRADARARRADSTDGGEA